MVAQMSFISGRSPSAFALAALCLGGQVAQAQSQLQSQVQSQSQGEAQSQSQNQTQANPVSAWTSGWQTGFGGSVAGSQGGLNSQGLNSQGLNSYGSNPYGDLLAFGGGATSARHNFSSRYNFDNGWFVGSERGGSGFGNFGPIGAWGNPGALSYEGAQFGYNFTSAPVTVYAGFDTLKFNTSPLASPLAFDSQSATAPGYGVHAGVEIRPTSNLSLSLGVGYAQQPTGIDTGGFNSVPGATSFAFGRR